LLGQEKEQKQKLERGKKKPGPTINEGEGNLRMGRCRREEKKTFPHLVKGGGGEKKTCLQKTRPPKGKECGEGGRKWEKGHSPGQRGEGCQNIPGRGGKGAFTPKNCFTDAKEKKKSPQNKNIPLRGREGKRGSSLFGEDQENSGPSKKKKRKKSYNETPTKKSGKKSGRGGGKREKGEITPAKKEKDPISGGGRGEKKKRGARPKKKEKGPFAAKRNSGGNQSGGEKGGERGGPN